MDARMGPEWLWMEMVSKLCPTGAQMGRKQCPKGAQNTAKIEPKGCYGVGTELGCKKVIFVDALEGVLGGHFASKIAKKQARKLS